MIDFLFGESILTFATMSGIFTANVLNSLKTNIIEPICENIISSHHLDNKQKFGNITYSVDVSKYNKSIHIKWQTFLRDFIVWLIIITILYFLWKKYKYSIQNKIPGNI